MKGALSCNCGDGGGGTARGSRDDTHGLAVLEKERDEEKGKTTADYASAYRVQSDVSVNFGRTALEPDMEMVHHCVCALCVCACVCV